MSFFKKLFSRKEKKQEQKEERPSSEQMDVDEMMEYLQETGFLKDHSENIEGRFDLHTFVSEVPIREEGMVILCKSFLTEGMTKVGQQEMILTVMVPSVKDHIQYLSIPYVLPFFSLIYDYAAKGMIVTEGNHTSLSGDSNILGFKGIVYAQHPEKADPRVPDDCLSMILLHQLEKEVAMTMGYMRMVTMFGLEELRYPFPLWNELFRKQPSLMNHMVSNTVLQQNLNMVDGGGKIYVYSKEREVILDMPQDFKLYQDLIDNEILKLGHLTFLPAFNLDIKFCKTWSERRNTMMVINDAKEGVTSDNLDIMGCFLTIIGMQDKQEANHIEDGYTVLLSKDDWANFSTAMENKTDFSVQFESQKASDLLAFKMIWRDE